MKKIKLLSAIGLNEKAPLRSIFLVILMLMGIGMTADLIAGDDRKWLGILFIAVSFGIYWWINYRSRNLSFEQSHISSEKKYLIAIIPSNIALLETIIKPYPHLKQIYFIHDNFPSDGISAVKERIKEDKRYSKASFLHTKSTQNPKNIISCTEDILEDLKNFDFLKDEVVIEVTTGQTLSSLTLYEFGKLQGIDIVYNISLYDTNNLVVPNSATPYKIEFDISTHK